MKKKMLTILVLVMFLLVNFATSIGVEVKVTNDIGNESTNKEEDCGCDITEDVNDRVYYTGLLRSEDPLPSGETFTGYTPPSWDWRDYNGKDWTTPIKDQGNCGSCYAFAPYASWESCYKIESNSPDFPIDLSEQYMVSCGSQGWGHGLIHGCTGGALEGAYYFMDEHGAIPESCFPYSSGGGNLPRCENKCSNWWDLKTEIDWWGYVQQSQISLKNAIIEKGPIVTGIYVYEDFFDYSGGIYKHTYGDYDSMHLLTVVGYNDDPGYWICKNSWGEDWGEPNPYDPNSQGGWCRMKYYECYFGFVAAFLDVHVDEYIEQTFYGQDYTEKEGDVVDYDASHLPGGSEFAVRMAHSDSEATVYYEFDIGNDEVVEGMPIRVEYKDTSSGGGPSLYVYDWSSSNYGWKCLKKNLGNQNKLKWIWVPTQNSNDYVNSSGLVRIKVVAESNDDTILDEVAIRFRYPVEDLDCHGSIEWVDIPPFGSASGNFKVKNIGDPGTELDWEITEWPEWGGPWFFFPKNETGRKPEDGYKKVEINVQVPNDPGGEYFGVIKVVNKHDSNDWEVITIDLTIKENKAVERVGSPLLQLLLRILSFTRVIN